MVEAKEVRTAGHHAHLSLGEDGQATAREVLAFAVLGDPSAHHLGVVPLAAEDGVSKPAKLQSNYLGKLIKSPKKRCKLQTLQG